MIDEDDIPEDLEARMRAKLAAPGATPPAEAPAMAKAEKEPMPKKVLLERVREWGDIGYDRPNAVHWRWFLYSVLPDGTRKQILNTTSDVFAKREVERYQKMGIPVEALTEHGK